MKLVEESRREVDRVTIVDGVGVDDHAVGHVRQTIDPRRIPRRALPAIRLHIRPRLGELRG